MARSIQQKIIRKLENWTEPIAKSLWGCNGNEALVHLLLNCHFIKHKMQVKVEMPEIARNANYILVDFVFHLHGQEVWIEYNGSQHYVYNGRYQRNQDDFSHQQHRDKVVRQYCASHGIRLIEIVHSLHYPKMLWRLHKELSSNNLKSTTISS
jgi:hypothetical protein